MRFLLFLILCMARYAVRCDDDSNSYYVIEMPDVPRDYKKPFRVYWNVPTMQCKSKQIPFDNLHEKYGIIQNKDDRFLGEKIAILYDPGLFPALLKDENSGKFKFRNGGVPQEGSLDGHLDAFKNAVSQSIPDTDFSGVAIIDFESWRPVFRQNFGVLTPYKDVSFDIEHKMHWWWPKAWIIAEAKQRFEEAARSFMQSTVSVAKQMRPAALWGYYGFPYCFNMASNNMLEDCPPKVMDENEKAYWLWAESTALYPSVYSSQDLSSSELSALIRGRLREASRLKRRGTPILPYFWYRYRDGGFLKEGDLATALQSLYKSNASGFIIWGSSNDVNTVEKCLKLRDYVETTLGPYIAKYTKSTHRYQNTEESNTLKPTSKENSTISNDHFNLELNFAPEDNILSNTEQPLLDTHEDFNQADKLSINDSFIIEILMNMSKNISDSEKVIDANQSNTEATTELVTDTSNIDISSTIASTITFSTISEETTTELEDFHEDITSFEETTTESSYLNENDTTESYIYSDSLTENYGYLEDLSTTTDNTYNIEDSEEENIENDEFLVLFTNLSSQILDFTTEDNTSEIEESSTNNYEDTTETDENLSSDSALDNSTDTLQPDEEPGLSDAAAASTASLLVLLSIALYCQLRLFML